MLKFAIIAAAFLADGNFEIKFTLPESLPANTRVYADADCRGGHTPGAGNTLAQPGATNTITLNLRTLCGPDTTTIRLRYIVYE